MSLDKAVDDLQKSLAQVDLSTRSSGGNGFIEFLVLKFQNVKIKMYQETGHQRPHIHIDYGSSNHVASYTIDDCLRISGNLDGKYDKTIKAWMNNNREQLLTLWKQANSGGNIKEYLVGIKKA